MFALDGLVGRPPHISDLGYLEHLLVVDLHLVELVRVPPVDRVRRRPVELRRRVEVRRMRHCRVRVGRMRLVVVSWENLREGVTDFETSVEADTFIDGAIESHEVAWVLIVMLSYW